MSSFLVIRILIAIFSLLPHLTQFGMTLLYAEEMSLFSLPGEKSSKQPLLLSQGAQPT